MTTEAECPAHWALAQERVEHRVIVSEGPFGYGDNFADLWERGEPFIHLEHDIVPWPGAIDELAGCPESWCAFESIILGGRLSIGFGIGKHSPEGKAPCRGADWEHVETAIRSYLREHAIREHIHTPPVAHARRIVA